MRVVLLLQFFLFSFIVSAQSDIYQRLPLTDNGSAGAIVSPEAFLGYRLGERFTEYARSVEYFRLLAEHSDRIVLEQYGETYEQRPLLLLTVTAEANVPLLERIRAANLDLVAGTQVRGGDEERGRAGEMPVINSYSYNIHGNEASSTEAAMQFAYELATTRDPELLRSLEQSVNLLFVCINPDGRDRYVYWANSVARETGGESPRDLEHYAPWPNGRTNHYWFDLNRDWVWGVHPESRGHTAAYQKWMPHVHTDYHEQGYDANYFTVPGTTPRNLLLPDAYEMWADTFGRANIAEFDKKGLSYFTRDRFDFYYPSYGSSYPSVMGAIGMLTEQGGIAAHRAVETEDGYVLTFRQRIYDHYTTSVAQLKAAVRNREALIGYSRAAWDPANSKAAATNYVIANDGNEYLEDVTKMLLLNGVEVRRTTGSSTAPLSELRTSVRAQKELPAGSLVVSTDQPRHLFVNSILSPTLAIEDSVMYDMSTWSALLAYNLTAYTSPTFSPETTVLSPERFAREQAQKNRADAGPQLNKTGIVRPKNGKPLYAYVTPWNKRGAPAALAALWQAGVRVRAANQPFTTPDGTVYPAGSLIVLAGRNDQMERNELNRIINQAGIDNGVVFAGYTSGRMKEGMDLASTRNFPVRQPKVALLVEPPFNTYTSGQLYFLFDQEVKLPVDRIRISTLLQTDLPRFGSRYGYTDLNDYDVVLLPEANRLGDVFGQNGQRKLKEWLAGGGTLIAIGSAAQFLTDDSGFLKDQKIIKPAEDTSAERLTLPYAERTDYFGKRRIPGSALHATIDVTHPLGYGLPPEVYSLKFGANALKPDAGLLTVGRYATDAASLLASGYASPENLETLAGNTWAGVRPYGRGNIVYFMDNPHYRMFWRGPSRMMVNAVMMVGGGK